MKNFFMYQVCLLATVPTPTSPTSTHTFAKLEIRQIIVAHTPDKGQLQSQIQGPFNAI